MSEQHKPMKTSGQAFQDSASKHLIPILAKRGFTQKSMTENVCRFQSEDFQISITFDPYSYEVETKIMGRTDFTEVSLAEVLQVKDSENAANDNFGFQSGGDNLDDVVRIIAQIIDKDCWGLLSGGREAFDRIFAEVLKQRSLFTLNVMLNPSKQAGEEYWKEKDYEKLIKVYGSIEAYLTPIEARRLRYARQDLGKKT